MEKPNSLCHLLLIIVLLPLWLSLAAAAAAASESTIKYLPGFDGPLPFDLETGYVGVGEKEEAQLFYYFVKSEGNPVDDPVVLWLTGGPGCSALSGLVYEIGPMNFEIVEYNGSLPSLVLNPDSWTQAASIIFVDMPVGTGFSYATSIEESQSSDFLQIQQAYEFLRKWLIDHPEFITNPVYVGGDSFSGLIVPGVVANISDGNEEGKIPFINLKVLVNSFNLLNQLKFVVVLFPFLMECQLYDHRLRLYEYLTNLLTKCSGYLLGNAATDPLFENNFEIPYAFGHAIISYELYQATAGINHAQILEPQCAYASPKPMEILYRKRYLKDQFQGFLELNDRLPTIGCHTYGYLLSKYWANDKSVQTALHIKEGSIGTWQRCNYGLPYAHQIFRSVDDHLYLSEKGYRSLVYSGDHDMMVTYLGTQAWIRALNFSIVDDWRSWHVENQVSGYTRTYSNKMTFATVKGGGHTAPEYKSHECFAMFRSYIGVGEAEEVQLFYYFVKSERNPEQDPLLLWLTGGPGCSALSGLAFEIGPLRFQVAEYNGSLPTLLYNPDSWTKVSSIIFVDSPVGTGFSYATTNSTAIRPSDIVQVSHAEEFLRKVGNENGVQPFVNLKGYMIGNPVTGGGFDNNAQIPFAHGMALISDELYQSLEESCGGEYERIDPTNLECLNNLKAFRQPQFYSYLICKYWADDVHVRRALHVREGTIDGWIRCNYGLGYVSDIPSSFEYHVYLSTKGYRSLIYSGDHDIVVPFLGTQTWIRALNYSIVEDWRSWHVEGQVA
ncbi:unnamed protein product, partial [Linum tenue]